MKAQTCYTIMEIKTGKFIERFTKKSGRVYLVKNAFNSNYFISFGYAQKWLDESGLNQEQYKVQGFIEGEDASCPK